MLVSEPLPSLTIAPLTVNSTVSLAVWYSALSQAFVTVRWHTGKLPRRKFLIDALTVSEERLVTMKEEKQESPPISLVMLMPPSKNCPAATSSPVARAIWPLLVAPQMKSDPSQNTLGVVVGVNPAFKSRTRDWLCHL